MKNTVNERIALINTIRTSKQKGPLTLDGQGLWAVLLLLGPSPGSQDPGFLCALDLELVPRPSRASLPDVFSQEPPVLLVHLPLTSESGQMAGVCRSGGVCVHGT